MPIQPTRPEAEEDGTLDAYAHLYDVKAEERDRIAADEAEKQARQVEDARLDSAITKEVEDRKKADEEIKGMIGSSDINVISPLKVQVPATTYYNEALAIGNNAVVDKTAGNQPRCVAIGNEVDVGSRYSTVVGFSASAPYISSSNIGCVAFGFDSTAYGRYCGAIGSYSSETDDFAISFGDTNPPVSGWDGLRRLTHVSDPTKVHDAATKNYVDTHAVTTSSTSITVSGNTAKLNPEIFSDGITATDAQVSADMGFIGEHLAGDGLYYDATDGLQVKVGDGLEVQNDTIAIDQDKLPLASASNRGTVKVGSGLAVSSDGTLRTTGASIPSQYNPMCSCFTDLSGTGVTDAGTAAFPGHIFGVYVNGPNWVVMSSVRARFKTTAAFTSGTTLSFTLNAVSGATYTAYNLSTFTVDVEPAYKDYFGEASMTSPLGKPILSFPVLKDVPSDTTVAFTIH